MKPFHVYLLRCSDGSYYCGHTDNVDVRMQQHDAGVIGYTATRKPVTLVWQSECEKREEALAFEQQIKGWSRAKKEALIAGDWERISKLACSKKKVTEQPAKAVVINKPPFGLSLSKPILSKAEGPSTDPALRQAQGERGDIAATDGSEKIAR